MTLLASERSLLIRNKFRSVLQLRIQNRRQSEIHADPGSKSSTSCQDKEMDKSGALRLTDEGAAQKTPPSGVKAETAQERSDCGVPRQRKSRRVQDLREGIQDPPGPQGRRDKPPPGNGAAVFPPAADVFEDDVSRCSATSSSASSLRARQAAAVATADSQSQSDLSSAATPLNHSPGHTQTGLAFLPATEGISSPMSNSTATTSRPTGIFLISQTTPLLPKTARPPSPSPSLTSAFNLKHLGRSRKPRDSKPKMKKLKYHQYIPPDQRRGSGVGGEGSKQRSPPSQPLDPAYSHLVKQQQVFLQLQIIQNQQQQEQQVTVVHSRDQNSSGALRLKPHPAAINHASKDTNLGSKHDLLPANLMDLTVSELRQQLRKRGLHVSGTKPALLQRLRPFQLPPTCVTPAPLYQLGGSIEPSMTPSRPMLVNRSPSSSCSSGNSPGSSPNQQTCIQDQEVPNGILNIVPNGLCSGLSVSLAGEQCSSINAVFLGPACTASGAPSPSLPLSSCSPVQCGTPWRTELGSDLDQKERINGRAKDAYTEFCKGSLHPFLQQDPGCSHTKPEKEAQTKVLFTEVFCSKPCDMIGRDYELPVQITSSPDQNSPGIRSLEEELLEAIQKAQMDPRQSIEDILDEPFVSVDSKLPTPSPLSPPPQVDPPLKSQHQFKDANFLPSPLCSSLLLELPPSPAVIPPSQVIPALLPPPICNSPPLASAAGKSRKRRAQAMIDAADILETLTSGFRPLTPPAAPFGETDFGLDSDLNINRVLDLMIEQW
ncbi:myocardin [Entelurus aequoreus]|uniref:myocardin n=1 Tax=Entelurus aequoreus TaxID=161455 RepID=UPI002B1D83C6|nr:myocardin [Entelurus aequoreus]